MAILLPQPPVYWDHRHILSQAFILWTTHSLISFLHSPCQISVHLGSSSNPAILILRTPAYPQTSDEYLNCAPSPLSPLPLSVQLKSKLHLEYPCLLMLRATHHSSLPDLSLSSTPRSMCLFFLCVGVGLSVTVLSSYKTRQPLCLKGRTEVLMSRHRAWCGLPYRARAAL